MVYELAGEAQEPVHVGRQRNRGLCKTNDHAAFVDVGLSVARRIDLPLGAAEGPHVDESVSVVLGSLDKL